MTDTGREEHNLPAAERLSDIINYITKFIILNTNLITILRAHLLQLYLQNEGGVTYEVPENVLAGHPDITLHGRCRRFPDGRSRGIHHRRHQSGRPPVSFAGRI